uniref:HTH_48 domain-containing protein n=1 Tax=Caenorhabditis japonica TaxID=281687 RepID=A0A8R1IYY5_CAEJA
MDHFRPDQNHPIGRQVILFLFLSNLKVLEVHRRLVLVYKAKVPHENTIRIWFGKFENKDISLDDASRSELSGCIDNEEAKGERKRRDSVPLNYQCYIMGPLCFSARVFFNIA